jgi:hypothetical protein
MRLRNLEIMAMEKQDIAKKEGENRERDRLIASGRHPCE